MIYEVKAKFNYDKAREFHQKLTDSTIEKQRPDGPEIVSSMNRATIDDKGYINWTEMCFCATPLQHERATVYDSFFTEMKTVPIPEHRETKGKSFMKMLTEFNGTV